INTPMAGYLPKGAVTKYRTIEFSKNGNMTLTLESLQGDPKLYGYICEDIKECFFTPERLKQEREKGTLIHPMYTFWGWDVFIQHEVNQCHKIRANGNYENLHESLPCAALAVIECEGEEDCSYRLTMEVETG